MIRKRCLIVPIIALVIVPWLFACKHSGNLNNLYAIGIVPSDSLSGYRDTIVGRFNGIDLDTLICEPVGPITHDNLFGDLYFEWRVFTAKGTVKEFIVGNTIGMELINEGDLDKNNTEEWGFMTLWPTSSWTVYNIFTVRNGEWKRLVEPIRIWREHFEGTLSESDIAQPSDIKNHIQIKYSDVIDDITNWVVVDTIIPISINDYSYELVEW